MAEYVEGVRGSALKFDGFSTYVQGTPQPNLGVPEVDGGTEEEEEEEDEEEEDEEELQMPRSISVEAWIALATLVWIVVSMSSRSTW